MNRNHLIQELRASPVTFKEEPSVRLRFEELLLHPRAYYRDHLPGHITGSSWIVNEDLSKVLLVLHAKLGRWLQPGGHADGDENLINVALREAQEETGLTSLKILNESFFDLDIHPIPDRKDFPKHDHYDVRYFFTTSTHYPLIISEESRDLKWFPLEELANLTGNVSSIMRMVDKTLTLKK